MLEPQELERIEASLGAVRAVGGVVSAVWALARAQLPRVEQARGNGLTYLAWLDRVVDEIAGAPLEAPPGRTFLVVVGPERPFCGDVARRLLEAVPEEGELGLVGTRLIDVASHALAGREVAFTLPAAAGVDELSSASERLAGALLERVSPDLTVELLYPGARRLLLATRRAPPRGERDRFSPPDVIAAAAAAESVIGHLRAALTEALVAETRARLAMAERARRAVHQREEDLSTALRVLERQAITRELLELAAANEASLGAQRA